MLQFWVGINNAYRYLSHSLFLDQSSIMSDTERRCISSPIFATHEYQTIEIIIYDGINWYYSV